MFDFDEIPTEQEILQRMLDRIPNTFDKRQGSIIYDALAPAAVELAQMYITAASDLQLVFVDSSVGEYLDRLVEQNGITRKQATNAIRKGTFNKAIPNGSRFSLEDTTYIVLSPIDGSTTDYRLQCEQTGSIGNRYYGTLTPLSFIQGLTVAELTDIIDMGDDPESDEDLRQRYIDSVTAPQFGGNISDYKIKTKALEGVGGVKVIPIWDGPGTVKLIISDSTYNAPTQSLIDDVQEAIDPTGDQTGIGIAPIGHKVTVVGAVEDSITVATKLVLEDGKIITDVQQAVNEVVGNYFSYLRSTWDNTETLIVRISQIETRILGVQGVLDVSNTTINSNTGNYEVASEDIPELNGMVVITT